MRKPQAKVARVMREFKAGELKSSSGQKVTNPKQAIAIGLSEAGISKKAKGGEMKESKAMVKKEVSFMKKKGAPKSMLKHEMAEAGMKHGGKVKKMALGGMGNMPDKAKAATQAAMDQTKRAFSSRSAAPAGVGGGLGGRPAGVGGSFGGGIGSSTLDRFNKLSAANASKKFMAPAYSTLNPATGKFMKQGGAVKKMASGGLAAGHKAADGVAVKGKTKAKQVTMAGSKNMKYGGKC